MRIALVHDYLTQYGGAERVLAALHDCWPQAPIFTSLYDPAALPVAWRSWDIRPSRLGSFPGAARWHRLFAPLYPVLFQAFGPALRDYDVVLADSSAWSHHAPARAGATHLCYCHTPPRFLYGDRAYLEPARLPRSVAPVTRAGFALLRRWDQRAASRIDRYFANSRTVAERIRALYGRAAPVIYPPVDLVRFAGMEERSPEPWCLVVSRLVPHKRVDLAVEAFTALGLPLKVIGDGRAAPTLKARAGPTIEFLGWQDDRSTAEHLARCRALILPAMEDFGITAVEAQAAGRPVVAFAAGGALETVVDGETGLFFTEQSVESLARTVDNLGRTSFVPAAARRNAARFGVERFQREISAAVEGAVAARRSARVRQ